MYTLGTRQVVYKFLYKNKIGATRLNQISMRRNCAIYSATKMVGAAGLEPARPKSRDFKSPASANSATPPDMSSYYATTFRSVGAKLASKLQATAFPGKRLLRLPRDQKVGHSRLPPGA